MNATSRLHVIVFDDELAMTAWGTDPCDAVKGHYDEMDAYCPPRDPGMSEEFHVTVFGIPERIENDVAAAFEDLDGDEVAAALHRLRSEHSDISETAVNVVYTIEGASVSELKPLPDLLGRAG